MRDTAMYCKEGRGRHGMMRSGRSQYLEGTQIHSQPGLLPLGKGFHINRRDQFDLMVERLDFAALLWESAKLSCATVQCRCLPRNRSN